MHPCTCVAPARTAARELATAQPESLWKCTPTCVSNSVTMRLTMRSASCGSVPPLVSHSTSVSAPASAAARNTRSENSGFSPYPSKKCSASKNTRSPCERRNSTDSAAIATASSSVVRSASVACSCEAFHDAHRFGVGLHQVPQHLVVLRPHPGTPGRAEGDQGGGGEAELGR